MTIAVFGSEGLLGAHLCRLHSDQVVGFTKEVVDITDEKSVEEAIKEYNITSIINCAGITNKNPDQNKLWQVNSLAPVSLSILANKHNVRLIHVSTDCVFSGSRGNYVESDTPDPVDLYGLSKRIGEVLAPSTLVVRCSFVGWPDPKNRGLLAWLHDQNDPVPGYTNHYWNGLTTVALAKSLLFYATRTNEGIVHLSGETLSKYSLLKVVNEVYGWGKEIYPYQTEVAVNRTLSTEYMPAFIPNTHKFEKMVKEMKKWESLL